MANINRRWKRACFVGCSHGDLADPDLLKQVLAFKKAYKPEIRVDLGDIIDTAAFRAGSRGTKDEARPVGPDFYASRRWMQAYEPTHLAYGNHCWRVYELQDHPNAILAHAASTVWNSLADTAAKLKTKTVPYDLEKGWFEMGGLYVGHGYMYGENALRDHAEYLGGPVVMAHLHRAHQCEGRTRAKSTSYCTGMLGDPELFTYARRRRATSRWNHGIVFGEICEDDHQLWLSSCAPGGQLKFPFKI